jgi:short-subunit dehydrogenase
MNINLHSAVNCTLAAIDALRESSGHVVNIGSLSCKTAWPFMAPYTASKFALAAFNHQLRLEGPSNVHYMLVCPGPIRRDDAGIRYDHQTGGLPDVARKPAAGARVRDVDPDVLADRIIAGCETRKLELMPLKARLIYVALSWSPRLGDWLLRRKMKK